MRDLFIIPNIPQLFCRDLRCELIVKAVAGTPKTPVMTGRVTPELVASDSSVSLCPAIYQELVPGTRHLRICCFGDDVRTALLETDALDWRYPLEAEVQPYDLDETTADPGARRRPRAANGDRRHEARARRGAGLAEINPQGQFLFLEGMCELPLRDPFADFLLTEADSVQAAR